MNMKLTELADLELVEIYKHGSKVAGDDAIAILLQRKSALMFGIINRITKDSYQSQDLLQEIREKKFIIIPEFNRLNYFQKNIDAFLCSIARNWALDWLRNQNRVTAVVLPKTSPLEQVFELTDNNYIAGTIFGDENEDLETAIETLNEADQRFILLWLELPKKKQEIMRRLGVEDKKYRAMYQRILGKLKIKILELRSKK